MISDEQIREALEFALEVLRQAERQRLGLTIPRPLQPLLKHTRLNKVGLATVRRVLEEDEALRSAIGEAHRIQVGVDGAHPGDVLLEQWLLRPEGWEETLAAYLAEQAEARRLERVAVEERSAEKRLAAAERHLERARADLSSAQTSLGEERSRRSQAERRIKELETTTAALERQLEEARSETRRAKRAAEAAGSATSDQRQIMAAETARNAELEAENLRLTGLLDEALRARVEAESAIAQTATPSLQRDPAVDSAAESLKDAARVLADATDSMTRALAVQEQAQQQRRPRPARRTSRAPVAIPGGRMGDDVEVARFLVAVRNIAVIVDGYNVAKTAWPDVDVSGQRDRLVDLLENLVRRSGTRVRVVFDGSDVIGWANTRRLVLVQFSPDGVIADDVIREVVAALPDSQPVLVVTSDRELAASVRALGANTVGSRQFLDSLR